MNQYYLANKERYNAQSKRWRQENRERYNELQRNWRKEHPEQVKKHIAQSRVWQKNNPDKIRAIRRRASIKHRQKNSKWKLERYHILKQNPEWKAHFAATQKLWAKKNPDKVREKAMRWRQKNPEKIRAYARVGVPKRRALKRGNTVHPKSILMFINGVKQNPFAVCYYCQKRVSTRNIHFDHIIPLSKGGAHSVENLCVSCAPCNCKKHNTLIQDWMVVGQQILAL